MELDQEIGRELTAADLKVKTVVVLGQDDRPDYVTTWVQEIGVDFVTFQAAAIKLIFIAKRLPDDTLQDDKGRRIHVFEYLGEV
jgi:hypothetical protein